MLTNVIRYPDKEKCPVKLADKTQKLYSLNPVGIDLLLLRSLLYNFISQNDTCQQYMVVEQDFLTFEQKSSLGFYIQGSALNQLFFHFFVADYGNILFCFQSVKVLFESHGYTCIIIAYGTMEVCSEKLV